MKGRPGHLLLLALLVAGLPGLGGCAVVMAAGAVAGAAATGITYYANNVAEKTFTTEFSRVWAATLKALEEMAIEVVKREGTKEGGSIEAVTPQLKISIEVTPVTPRSVRVRVDAARPNLLRDRATATEIIDRITTHLSQPARRRG